MKHKKRMRIFFVSAAGLLLLMYSCTQSGPCEGSLTLENPIPDTTVLVGDTLFIDLTDPPVFVSSEGKVTYSYSSVTGTTHASANIIMRQVNNQSVLTLRIAGLASGERVLKLEGTSGCLENSQLLTINVIEP